MSSQVILFIGQEKVGISQKMRVIPTFSFYSTRTIEPKQSPGREKHEIGQSYRSITSYRSGNQNLENPCSEFRYISSLYFPDARVHAPALGQHIPDVRNSCICLRQGIQRILGGSIDSAP